MWNSRSSLARLALVFLPTTLALTSTALAQSSNPAWLDDLNIELMTRENCEVGYYIFVRESELAGKLIYEARAQCVDGRQFDAVRQTPDLEFTIRQCAISTC